MHEITHILSGLTRSIRWLPSYQGRGAATRSASTCSTTSAASSGGAPPSGSRGCINPPGTSLRNGLPNETSTTSSPADDAEACFVAFGVTGKIREIGQPYSKAALRV